MYSLAYWMVLNVEYRYIGKLIYEVGKEGHRNQIQRKLTVIRESIKINLIILIPAKNIFKQYIDI